MRERRGICPVCGQTKSVTARGVMRMHWLPVKRYDLRSGQFRDYCRGTGLPPAWGLTP